MEVKCDMIKHYGAEVVKEDESHLVDKFINYLDKKIYEAKDQLIERFEYICSQPMESAKFMYENNTMAGYIPEEGIRSALKHGTLAIGQLGLAEALEILIGKNHLTTEGMELALYQRVEWLLKHYLKEALKVLENSIKQVFSLVVFFNV